MRTVWAISLTSDLPTSRFAPVNITHLTLCLSDCSPLPLYFLAASPLARSSVVTAVKFTVVDQPVPIDSLLKDCIGETQTVHMETKTIFGIKELISNYIYCNKHLNEKNLVCSPAHYPIQPPGGDRHFKLMWLLCCPVCQVTS